MQAIEKWFQSFNQPPQWDDASDDPASNAVIIKVSDQKPESMEWKPIKGMP